MQVKDLMFFLEAQKTIEVRACRRRRRRRAHAQLHRTRVVACMPAVQEHSTLP
jgi:hypothetical protein